MSTPYLIAWLTFDDSPTEDLCGNTWTATGSPTIGTNGAISGNALQLDGSSYLQKSGSISLGGQDFTICGWFNLSSSSGSFCRIFSFHNANSTTENCINIARYSTSSNLYTDCMGSSSSKFAVTLNENHYFTYVYQHDEGKVKIFIDGELKLNWSRTIARTTFPNVFIGKSNFNADGYPVGSIDEFQIYDGVALHTENFTPPTADDYFEQRLALTGSARMTLTLDVARHLSNRVAFSVDVARIISNSRFIVVKQSLDVARKIVKSVSFTVDVARTVKKTWRYVNRGTADDLITSGTTLTDLPATKSKTGTAFYQTTRAKCFDLPVTSEVWMKFDVYFNGSQRWRAYNGGTNGSTGLTVQTSGDLSFFSNSSNVQQPTGVCKTNTLQTVLLHMVSGSSAGVVEAWVDGTKIYTYTGNVNHGQDFADIYLQSDGAGTFFSNVIISNAPIGLNDGYQTFSVDVVRRLRKRFEFTLDVARNLIAPITVPLIGDHFNHLVKNVKIFGGGALKIILPKSGRVYFRGKSNGIIRFYSDADPQGVTAGQTFFADADFYADLDANEKVFDEITNGASSLQVIQAFMHALKTNGYGTGTYLNKAISYATVGKFSTANALINQFWADLDSYDDYNDFLLEKCGIDLDNEDTGAITGSDAGGLIPKTAESVVPNPLPIEEWVVPQWDYWGLSPRELFEIWLADDNATLFDEKTIRGIKFYFPSNGASGTGLTDKEKFIVAGLVNVWIEQALILVEKSLGVTCGGLTLQEWYDFSGDYDTYAKIVYVEFVADSNDSLAYISTSYFGTSADAFYLYINMTYFSRIDMTSEDGKLKNDYPRLDRILAHEFTHMFMRSNMRNDDTAGYNALPLWLKEGMAELVHGVDDQRRSSIIGGLNDDRGRGFIAQALAGYNDNWAYTAGFMLLRYMAKQGQNPTNDFVKSPVTAKLLISDGATDYFYNALTDNTRQTFSLDVLRTLNKHVAFGLDVVIRDVIPVNFSLDVARAILAELILFPIDNTPLLQSKALPRLRASKQNTQGLQSFEVTIGEQQITEQVKFAGIIPFEILQKVNGQYLDYHFDMRVEKVQQEGIIYRCECCSDLDQLLFTQLAYTIPPTTWRKVGADDKTVEIQTYYPPATTHVQKIASALGLTPVMQFDNFLSTVLMDDLGGVTYNDLIRDVFGWSSRVPHMLINCYIRNGKLFVIQRGHEANTIDISNAKCSMPVITKELIRTTWGSTPWSKTQTTEFQHSTWQAGVPDDVTISGGSDTGGGGSGGSTIPSSDDTEEKVREVSTSFYGKDYSGNTTYTYDKKGLLVQTYTHMEKDVPNSFASQITNTTVTHGYDDDNTMIYTETNVQSYGPDGDSSSRSIEEKGYVILPNGEKFLAWEHSATYQNDESISLSDNDLVDSKVTVHSPSRVGQSHTITIGTDGEIIGSAAGQNTGDDRVTPFSKYKTALLSKQLFKKSSGGSSGGNSGGSSSGEWTTETETYELTTNGLSLYDSSFPIHDEATLIKVTNALKWLNRKTQETLIISVYEFPHLIDFNDRVVLNGKTYFLVNNTAATTPRIFNEQNLTLARWY